ncbi:MAG: nucleotidyltransferase family protein [Clostridia bacterium]|nr:nucleotidyltransferase family protein [Clostridia bacterium]
MQVCGVICEYNPFHRGHALHLERARALSGADYIVCAMSGSFTQRGTPALFDKWTRAKAALLGGADLVIELPARFCSAPAPEFAGGGVSLLAALGVLTHLSFGCEAESLAVLDTAARVLGEESPSFKAALRGGLDQGLPYPRARALAAQQASGVEHLDALISLPNASLALEYLRALPESIRPVPVVREGAGYHDETLAALSSATAIRAAIARGDTQQALAAVPHPGLLCAALSRADMHGEDALTQSLLYRLRTMDAAALSRISGMEEGLEHRFLAAAKTANTRDELILAVKSKRYTYARLSRICRNILLDVTGDFARENAVPTYARVLGFRRDAQPLLHAVKDRSSIPLITKTAGYDRSYPLFALDVRAQDLWSLGCASPQLRRSGRDFITGPVII